MSAIPGQIDKSNFVSDFHTQETDVELTARSLAELRLDRLSYIADMISELQVMAHETKCQTLAGILGLAQAEATQQRVGRIREYDR